MDSKELAKEIRINCLKLTNAAKSSHLGSMFSCADILAVLYGNVLKLNPKQPMSLDRDYFLQSKGHAGCAQYVCLSKLGFFDEKILSTYYQNGSKLGGHISHKGINGVEISTGSLGHALSIGSGIALELKKLKKKNRVFVLLSDGELDEGSNWEAILFSAHHKLNNLVAIVDYNKLQSIKSVEETLSIEPLIDKWNSFGWDVENINGHNHEEVNRSLNKVSKKPLCVIANTIKGKGVSFMENNNLWHYRSPQGTEFSKAIKELENL